ncbi:hypothetical protein TeGR_g7696 [Tetraparma gracilis]|uniref:SWIM-type domain-containing protein n=1 Tax=Tetraparma gracilis TaxID=2962635 RepID=A0ABQ6MNJ8_9STRA|nr:hypothetical protein TeGR_g7696 [Tetraparma gracilis]
MSRSTPYINKPPANFAAINERLAQIQLLLLSTVGPTMFVIKHSSHSKPFKVSIGSNHRCTCGGGEGRGTLCEHIVFVMSKVLRVPTAHPLCWQLGLTEPEIEACLKGDLGRTQGSQRESARAFLRRRSQAAAAVARPS